MQVQDTKSSGVVNSESTDFEQALSRNQQSMARLFQTYTLGHILERAVHDDRLTRAHLLILVALTRGMRLDTTFCIHRDSLSTILGVSIKTLRNRVSELCAWGYLHHEAVSRGQSIPQYTFGEKAINHEEIDSDYRLLEDAICSYINARKVSPYSGTLGQEVSPNSGTHLEVSPNTGTVVDKPSLNSGTLDQNGAVSVEKVSPYSGTLDEPAKTKKEKVPPTPPLKEKNKKLPPVGPPNSKKSNSSGKRLTPDWVLPRSWGEWALEHFEISSDEVRSEAAAFADYWHGVAGAKGRKVDWRATWRNWIRNSRKNWKPRKGENSAAPDLPETGERERPMTQEEREFYGITGIRPGRKS